MDKILSVRTMGVRAAKLLNINCMEKVHRLWRKPVRCKLMATEKAHP